MTEKYNNKKLMKIIYMVGAVSTCLLGIFTIYGGGSYFSSRFGITIDYEGSENIIGGILLIIGVVMLYISTKVET